MALKTQKVVNNLATTHPELAGQWHPTKNGELTPEDVTASTSKKVWWYLPYDVPEDYPVAHLRGKHYDFEWEVPVGRRVNSVNAGKVGCPFLTGRSIWIGFNDLQTVRPDLAIQWHPTKNGDLTPTDVTVKSAKKVWWQCAAGHEWESKVYGRANGLNCPYCSGKLPVGGENDLASTHPHIAAEWNYKKNKNLKDRNGRDISTPNKISAHSNQKVWWKCHICGYEWLSVVNDRTDNCGCPVCAGKKLAQGINDLATVNPELVKEWHPTQNIGLMDKTGRDISTPDKVSAGSHQKVWWKCLICGREWESSIYNRATLDNGCPQCAESKGEKAIRKILETNHIKFEAQYKFKDRFLISKRTPLRDDFAILNQNGKVVAAIEYNGIQHYFPVDFAGKGKVWAEEALKATQERDKIKSDYLKARNIPQLIIPYWDFDNIGKIVNVFIDELYKTTILV